MAFVSKTENQSTGQQQPNESPRTRLLVVDDEESVALTVSEVLRLDGYEVDTALSGEDAISRCCAVSPSSAPGAG